ncbi:MAG TPA: hypothetical protein VN285_05935 [Candidatus Deferrimicrobium sp.]|nr:hypothetical protein [Candidatus Deferrimicrobium sp.]
MSISGFIALAAENFVSRYLSRAEEQWRSAEGSPVDSTPEKTAAPLISEPADSYEPSDPLQESADTVRGDLEPTTSATADASEQDPTPTVESEEPPAVVPEATYFFRRSSELDYRLGLKFDLQAVAQTVAKWSEGDVEAFKEFAAGHFGLSADFDISGRQVVETNQPLPEGETLAPMPTQQHSLLKARQAQHIGIQSRNFHLQAFYREAIDIKNSLHTSEQDGYRRTVNKFAYRFTMDSRMHFEFLQRLNVQTQDVAEQMPQSLGEYLTSAGTAAEKAAPELMAAFFDAVDAYLEGAEAQIIERVQQFFDMAAENAGFTSGLAEETYNHLVQSIESFFNQVDESLASLQSRFALPETVQPTLPINEPTVLPAEFYEPAVTEASKQVAVA